VDVEKGVLRGGLGGVIGNYGWGRLSGGRIESVGNLWLSAFWLGTVELVTILQSIAKSNQDCEILLFQTDNKLSNDSKKNRVKLKVGGKED
jgi:hypothetical protein